LKIEILKQREFSIKLPTPNLPVIDSSDKTVPLSKQKHMRLYNAVKFILGSWKEAIIVCSKIAHAQSYPPFFLLWF
jgi:hypothetical protein